METVQYVYDRGEPPWFMCPRCMKQSNYHKYQETKTCPHCGDNYQERLEKEREIRWARIRKENKEKSDKREKNRLAYKPSKKDITLCKRIMKMVLDSHHLVDYVHGWMEFVCLYKWNEDGYGDLEESVTYAQILRAMKAGKHVGWITSKWTGIGITPFAGAGRRTMEYTITEKGKTVIQKLDNSKEEK